MSNPKPLPVWDREAQRLTQEYMTDSLPTYESRPHRSLANWVQSQPAYDWLVAAYQNTRLSARKIEPFIKKHNINMAEFEPGPFRTYAEFFERLFRPGMRRFPKRPGAMGAFAEARYFAWERLEPTQQFCDAFALVGGRLHHKRQIDILSLNLETAAHVAPQPGMFRE